MRNKKRIGNEKLGLLARCLLKEEIMPYRRDLHDMALDLQDSRRDEATLVAELDKYKRALELAEESLWAMTHGEMPQAEKGRLTQAWLQQAVMGK